MDNFLIKIYGLMHKYGIDKTLHFTLGGWLVSLFSPLGILAMTIAYVVLLIISIVKEKMLDAYADKKDIVAAMIGGTIAYVIGLLFVFV